MKTKLIFWVVLFVFAIQSCTNNEDLVQIKIGDKFIKSQSDVVIIDTLSVNMSTVLIDSISTSGTGQLLVGKYTDKFLGKITSTGFFQIDLPEGVAIDNMNENAVFDSLTLILNYSSLSYGDTTQSQTIHVHRIIEDIEVHNDGYLYNTSSFNYNETPVGNLLFYPEPSSNQELEIRLDNLLGTNLTELIKSGASEVSSSANFTDYFKGFAIVPGEDNSCILSFEGADSLPHMRLYTHYSGIEKVQTNYDFPIKSSSTCFNHIHDLYPRWAWHCYPY